MKRYYLALDRGSLRTSMHPLVGPTIIGRGPDNAIIIEEITASRSHARVSFLEGVWTVEDLGSTNGVFVAGKRITKAPLRPGDTFHIGAYTFCLVEMEVSGDQTHLSDTVQILSANIEAMGRPSNSSGTSSNPEQLQAVIAAIPFFSSLGKPELDRLASTSTLHVFQSGDIIIRQGDPGRSVYIILHGRVRVFTRDYKGQELELAVLGASQFFGEMSFLTGEPRSSYVGALENSVTVELSYTTMHRLAKESPQVKETLLRYYRDRVESTKKKREEAGAPERRQQKRVKERIPVIFKVGPQPESNAGPEGTVYRAVSRDLTMSGIILECREPFPEPLAGGSQVRLEIELPSPGEKVRAVATVRRFQIVTAEANGALVALEFNAMPSGDIQKLKGFLHGESHLPPDS
jgi:CRP/FNR family cyclic AMP-dependent transcriptional regulator